MSSVPSVDWRGKLRGVTLDGPYLVENDPRWGTHWKMYLLIKSKADNANFVAIDLRPMAFLFRVEGNKKTMLGLPPAQATTGDTFDPEGGRKTTPTGPVDVSFEFNNLNTPTPGRYFYRVTFFPIGTQDSEEFVIE